MQNGSKFISIRAHHLLCIQGFQGYGYDQDFIDNLAEVIEKIKSKPELNIKIIDECDDICSVCPHNRSGECRKEPDSNIKIKEMDNNVLNTLGLEDGSELTARDIFEFVNKRYKSRKEVEKICGDCDWVNECLWFQKQRKK